MMSRAESESPTIASRLSGWKGVVVIGFVAGVVGYLVGAAAAKAGLDIESGFLGQLNGSETIALSIGGFYLLVGVILAFALAAPKIGAHLLTGQDAEDLIDGRTMYIYQTIALLLLGGALVVLTLSGPGNPIAAATGGIISLLMMVVGFLVYAISIKLLDELMRLATLEAAVWTYGCLLVVGGGWAALAHLQLVAPPAMLDILSMFWSFSMVGSFIAVARRGMLNDN